MSAELEYMLVPQDYTPFCCYRREERGESDRAGQRGSLPLSGGPDRKSIFPRKEVSSASGGFALVANERESQPNPVVAHQLHSFSEGQRAYSDTL